MTVTPCDEAITALPAQAIEANGTHISLPLQFSSPQETILAFSLNSLMFYVHFEIPSGKDTSCGKTKALVRPVALVC